MKSLYEVGKMDCSRHHNCGYSLKKYKNISDSERKEYYRGFKEQEMKTIINIYANLFSVI